jgi:hypothetical protein
MTAARVVEALGGSFGHGGDYFFPGGVRCGPKYFSLR